MLKEMNVFERNEKQKQFKRTNFRISNASDHAQTQRSISDIKIEEQSFWFKHKRKNNRGLTQKGFNKWFW